MSAWSTQRLGVEYLTLSQDFMSCVLTLLHLSHVQSTLRSALPCNSQVMARRSVVHSAFGVADLALDKRFNLFLSFSPRLVTPARKLDLAGFWACRLPCSRVFCARFDCSSL